MNQILETLRSDLADIVGDAGVVAYDPTAGVITLVPARIPATPVVVQAFGDGWTAVMCGAGFYQEVPPDFGAPLAIGLVREIVEGRCTEYIVQEEGGDWRISVGLALADGSYAQDPVDGRRLVSWRHPAWAGSATTAEITPL